MNEEKHELKDRLIDFAEGIIRLSESLPGTKTRKHIDPDTAKK